MKKIAFIWYFNKAGEVYPNWRDGLRGALEEIEKNHQVSWFLDKEMPDPGDKYDFILFWDDSNSEMFQHLDKWSAKKGICLTTDPHNINNLKRLDVVFVESKPIYEAARMHGIRTIRAFGTDTDFFRPNPEVKKDIEYFYPATFSPWKRQRDIAHLGNKLWCVGTIQPDGEKDYEACVKNKVRMEIGYFPAEKIRDYYWRAKKVIIPAVHGSERTVLESMACGIVPEIINDNQRAKSYVKEFKRSHHTKPETWTQRNYSHKIYAEQLLRGIEA